MAIPLDNLLDHEENVYTLTVAMIRRAAQITVVGSEDLQKKYAKIVPVAIDQVIRKKVEFQIGE